MQEEKNINVTETLDAGAYEIIRKRLLTQKDFLSERLTKLNEARKEVFKELQQKTPVFHVELSRSISCVFLGTTCISVYAQTFS